MDSEPQFCRLCLVPVNLSNAVVLNQATNLIESIRLLTTIDVIVDPERCVFMCEKCQKSLDLSIQFRTMCLQNDDIFRKKYANHTLTLNDLKQESTDWAIPCKTEDEYHSDEELVALEPEINIDDSDFQENAGQSGSEKDNKKSVRDAIPEPVSEHQENNDKESEVKKYKKKKSRKKHKPQSKPSPDSRIVKVQCQVCGEFYSRDTLRRHLMVHKEDRPMYACDQCPKKYPYRKNLKDHIEIVHKGRADHTCEQCGKTYNRRQALNQHYIAEHTDLKKYECSVCKERFARSSALNYHFKMNHTSERPFACQYCEMAFKRSNDLTLHVRTHTGEKPYKCDLCDKRFAKSYNVVIHKKSHKNAEMKGTAQLGADSLALNEHPEKRNHI